MMKKPESPFKFFIIEGGDGLGKTTVIKQIAEYYNYDNIMIRHFGKPPEDQTAFQANAFYHEGLLVNRIAKKAKNFSYYPEIVIWNRSHIGEYVYGQLYRNRSAHVIQQTNHTFEKKYIVHLNPTMILLDSTSLDFFMNQEDGKSISIDMDNKNQELRLFREAFSFSLIEKKKHIIVNSGTDFKGDLLKDIKPLL